MNWFKRHLNWTVVLSWFATYLVFLALLAMYSAGIEPYVTDEIAIMFMIFIYWTSFVVFPVLIAGWALREKGRSWWWLLLIYVPIGALFFLSLENRSESQVTEVKEAKPEIEKQREEHTIQTGESDKFSSNASQSRIFQVSSIALAIVLIAVIFYCVVITRDRNALNTELESVEAVLTSTQVELSSTQAELIATEQTLASVQNELEAVQAKLKLYEETLGVKVFSGIPPNILKPDSLPINLINNPIATNPTWQELKAFLLADPTDDRAYRENFFNCTNFAEMLHNNAEAVGIKAAFVAVHFEDRDIGHALNAFKTTDEGLFYVDCTGEGLSERKTFEDDSNELSHPTAWDKIAYVVKGKEYGLISWDSWSSPEYKYYEQMKADRRSYLRKLEAYNKEVEEFNKDVRQFNREVREYEEAMSERWLIDFAWWLQIKEWERSIKEWDRALEIQGEELDSLRMKLKTMWEPLGIVTNINIYW